MKQHYYPIQCYFFKIRTLEYFAYLITNLCSLVILRAGDVPVINVLNRKWNDDSIAAIIDLNLSPQVLCMSSNATKLGNRLLPFIFCIQTAT